jgi:predicted phosphodiesterase
MRIAILSDIHGNLEALNAVIADMARQSPCDQVIVAGDLAWSGPWPAEVVDRVRGMGAAIIQGNTDAFFGRSPGETPPGKQGERFAAQLAWMQAQLGPERVAFLAGLPFSHRISPASDHDLLVVHANPTDLDQAIYPNLPDAELDELLLGQGEPDWEVLAFGHVHVPFTRRWRERLLADVGSVGLPMDGDPRATYAVFTWDRREWCVEHRRVHYPVSAVAHQMRQSGMPRGKHFAERLMTAGYNAMAQTVAAE